MGYSVSSVKSLTSSSSAPISSVALPSSLVSRFYEQFHKLLEIEIEVCGDAVISRRKESIAVRIWLRASGSPFSPVTGKLLAFSPLVRRSCRRVWHLRRQIADDDAHRAGLEGVVVGQQRGRLQVGFEFRLALNVDEKLQRAARFDVAKLLSRRDAKGVDNGAVLFSL